MFSINSNHENNQEIKYSISRRFSFALTGVITFIMVIFSVIVIIYNSSEIETRLKRQLDHTANLARMSLITAIWNNDRNSINDILNALSLDESVVFVKAIAIVNDNIWGAFEAIRPDFKAHKDFSFFEKSPRFIATQIDIKKKGEKIGILQIAMTRDSIRQQLIVNIATIISLMILIIAAISITSFFIIKRYVFTPLSKLAESAKLIANGNLEASISYDREDEIGSLADDFDAMRKAVRETNNMLEKRSLQLAESEKKFRAIYESSNDAIMILNEKSYSDCNPRALEIFGLENREELIGFHPADFSPRFQPDGQDSFSAAQDRIQTAFEHGHHRFEWIHRRKNGEDFPADVLLSAFMLEEKAVLQATVRDITERKQAEMLLKKTEARYRSLFDGVPVGLYRSTPEGKILDVNLAMVKMSGYPSRESYIADLAEKRYANPEDRQRWKTQMEREGIVNDFEYQYRRYDGTAIWVSNSARAVRDEQGKVMYYEGSLTDITERLEKQKAEREKKIAERANQSKSEFLANMSHEIRTPMNAILGFTELLVPLVADGQQKNYLQAIQAGGKSLLTLINDILDLSKIEAGKLEIRYEPVNPYTVFNEIRQIFDLRISQKNLEFVTEISDDIPKSLLLDEVRLRQVLFNLIGNSVKFTEKGYIKLAADRIFTADDRSKLDLIIRLEDTGIGIALDAQEKVFEAFKQQDGQNTRKYGGTGLGLTITRRLIEMMNGKITLRSDPGRGSTFEITLSDVAAAGTIPESEQEQLTDAGNFVFEAATILITDDVETNRLLIKAFFDNTDIRSIEAENGQEAVSAAEQLMPDLILMDITMPVMDGYEAVRQIRSNEKTKQIPVIALTARAMSQEKEKIISAGFDGYLTKPVNRAELFHEISRFLVHSLKEESSEKIPSAGIETLSPEVIEKLPEIIRRIENEFTPLWKDVCEKQFIGEIEDFAGRIVKFAEEYSLGRLADFGKEVINHCQNCDIENIESVMKFYPKLIGTFKTT
jgi:PAS domain S-box-containing protein